MMGGSECGERTTQGKRKVDADNERLSGGLVLELAFGRDNLAPTNCPRDTSPSSASRRVMGRAEGKHGTWV